MVKESNNTHFGQICFYHFCFYHFESWLQGSGRSRHGICQYLNLLLSRLLVWMDDLLFGVWRQSRPVAIAHDGSIVVSEWDCHCAFGHHPCLLALSVRPGPMCDGWYLLCRLPSDSSLSDGVPPLLEQKNNSCLQEQAGTSHLAPFKAVILLPP